MFGKKKAPPRIVGIDIQKNCIRYCTKKGDRFKCGELVVNGTIFKDDKLRNPDSLESAFEQISKALRIRTMNVVINAPNAKLLIKQVPIGTMRTEKEIREHVYFELGESISLPFEKPIFDLLILGQGNKQEVSKINRKMQSSILTFRGKKQKVGEPEAGIRQSVTQDASSSQAIVIQRNRFSINGHVPVAVTSEPILVQVGEVLKKGGHQLMGVDCSFLAYTRMFPRQINWGENFVLIEMNAGVANIVFFEELVPTYVQYEDYNQANWKYVENQESVQVSFRESAEIQALEGIAETINSVIDYFYREVSPNCTLSKIYLVGGHPMLRKEVVEIFSDITSIPVKLLTVKVSETNRKKIPDHYVLAAGLAMKEV